jgi:transposase
MSPSRYELSDLQWEKIKDFLPGRKESVGRTAADNRLFVNGVLWVLRSGARWADLPERYGKYKSVHKLGQHRRLGAGLSRVGAR